MSYLNRFDMPPKPEGLPDPCLPVGHIKKLEPHLWCIEIDGKRDHYAMTEAGIKSMAHFLLEYHLISQWRTS